MSVPVLVTAPTVPLVDAGELKLHLKVEDTDEDALIDGLIDAATAHLDGWSGVLGRCLVNQTWRQDYADWPTGDCLRLPFPDVSEVTLTYRDSDDAEQTVSSSLYEILSDARGSYLSFKSTFSRPGLADDREFPVSAELVAGYGEEAENVPAAIRVAAQMMAAHLYQNRGDAAQGKSVTLTHTTEMLIAPYRRVWL